MLRSLVGSEMCIRDRHDTQLESPAKTAPPLNAKKPKTTKSSRKESKKLKGKQQKVTTSTNENINAVPILMSMAEQAAKPKFLDTVLTSMSPEVVEEDGDDDDDLPSPSNMAGDLISFINNDDSSEGEDVIYTEDEDASSLGSGSDRLEVISDSEFQD